MNKHELFTISWTGSKSSYLDLPTIEFYKHIMIGKYGGNTSAGASKNEDGLLIWCNPKNNWEFVVLLDAHVSSESAELIIDTLTSEKESILMLLESSVEKLFEDIEKRILAIFNSKSFLNACREVNGETSCLICVRRDNYLWWFSVGDCMLYLFHPELAQLGQTLLNQRNFYEWIGRVNTFEQQVPCYSSGRRELRTGFNNIIMITDGFLQSECGMNTLYSTFQEGDYANAESFLRELHNKQIIDSTSFIGWRVDNIKSASIPSDSNSGRIDIR